MKDYGVDVRWREIEAAMDAAVAALEDREADQEAAALIQARETMRAMAREGRTYRISGGYDRTVVHLDQDRREVDRVELEAAGPPDDDPEAHRIGIDWVREG